MAGAQAVARSIMSVDLEDWFQVENLKAVVSRESWGEREYRVEAATETLLEIFAETETQATFFCLGWVAERSPELIRRVQAAGHEIGSHGYGHELVYHQDIREFREDVVRAKGLLEDITGEAVLGYRAPSFSITRWALKVLAETGHRYDSSVFPVSGHDRYGTLKLGETDRAPREQYAVAPVYRIKTESAGENGDPGDVHDGDDTTTETAAILEIPIATLTVGGHTLPWGGGGYFRLIPEPVFTAGFRRAVTAGSAPIFYLHPWEVDPGQPRMDGIRRSYRFRHYVNLHRTAGRLRRLCLAIPFDRADTVLGLR